MHASLLWAVVVVGLVVEPSPSPPVVMARPILLVSHRLDRLRAAGPVGRRRLSSPHLPLPLVIEDLDVMLPDQLPHREDSAHMRD